jgi:signal transduction histidine kinase
MIKRLTDSHLFRRFWDVAGAVSIQVKVLGIVLGVIMLLGVFVTLQMRHVLAQTLQNQLVEQADALATQFAAGASPLLLKQEFEMTEAYLLDRQQHYSSEGHNTTIQYIYVTGMAQPVTTRTDNPLPAPVTDSIISLQRPVPHIDAMLHLGIGSEPISQTMHEVTLQLLTITLVMIAVGFGAAFVLTRVLTRPIYDLVRATQAVTHGDFSQRVDRWANDEIGELAVAFNSMTASLAQAEVERQEREQLRSEYVNRVITAQEDERKRIARELHDSTGQSLTSLLVGLRNLKEADDPDNTPERIDELREIVSQTLDEVRQMAWQLRPSALDDLGLISALDRYIHDYQQRFNVQVDFLTRGIDKRLPLEIETTIYRIAQEALTNIARHAEASTASVIIDRRHNTLRIIVEDNGVGFVPSEQHRKSLGLQGIRERAALFNGTLTIETEPGHGTSLFIEIPLSNEEKSLSQHVSASSVSVEDSSS